MKRVRILTSACAIVGGNLEITPGAAETKLHAKRTYRESRSSAQWVPAIISFMIWRPVACNGPMPLPGRNHMPLSLSRQ